MGLGPPWLEFCFGAFGCFRLGSVRPSFPPTRQIPELQRPMVLPSHPSRSGTSSQPGHWAACPLQGNLERVACGVPHRGALSSRWTPNALWLTLQFFSNSTRITMKSRLSVLLGLLHGRTAVDTECLQNRTCHRGGGLVSMDAFCGDPRGGVQHPRAW